jgi:hypothetical protein
MPSIQKFSAVGLIAVAAIASGCGSSSHSSTPSPGGTTSSASLPAANGSAATASSAPSGPGALSGEAQSAATGDIPDNQVFLVFHNNGAGYSIKYPEGWTQRGSAGNVTFKDKNNLVHIFVARGAAPSVASVATQLTALKHTTPSLTFAAPRMVTIGSAQLVKVKYTTKSAPNPVTGRRVTLMVDRYELGRDGRVAVVDLGTPVGVDNVDAYRMMIESFTWR